MNKKKVITSVFFLIIAALIFLSGVWVGRNMPREEEVSFYGEVVRNDSVFYVKGIPENDINHRGEFILNLDNLDTPNTAYDALGNKVKISDLKAKQLIRIVYYGPVLEISPAIIENVTRIYVVE